MTTGLRQGITTFLSDTRSVPGTDLMGLRNTFRNPLRLAFTVLVVGISIGTSGSWVVMSSSALSFINDQIESDTWDIRADLQYPLSNDEALAMVALPDSEFSIPFMVLAGQVRSGDGEGSAFLSWHATAWRRPRTSSSLMGRWTFHGL
ncbi:MAG: hypothetical protein MZU91_13275 [Desulfosudis oleivorans]|nr:hypothetical protein [Desulfosudis oleivorans]